MAAQSRGSSAATEPGGRYAGELGVWLRGQEEKDLVRFVTIGSVDDGKSTLIGRLLHDAHGLYQDQLDAVKRASVRGSTRGAESSSEIDFSLFTDGLLAEREQGITIDVAYRYFATERRKFIIADTPGHVQYTRNMATGASTADVAVILVDARRGVLPQTRRHAHIAALLGIPHVVTCVNKMDLVGYDRRKFDAIAAELAAIARRVDLKNLVAIPVSALAGDNVVVPSAHMPWWTGGTMLEHLETVSVAEGHGPTAFRLPVQIVLRPHLGYRAFAGQIVSGAIRSGDEVVALPSGRRSRVVAVDVAGRDVGDADAPMSVAIRLADDIDISRGDMLVRPEDVPRISADFEADLVWMSERPLDAGKAYLLKHTTRQVRAQVEVLHGADPETLAPSAARALGLNDIGRVRVRVRAPLFFDAYRTNRATGAFILIDSVTNDTVAAGMIAGSAQPADGRDAADGIDAARRGEGTSDAGPGTLDTLAPRTQVSAQERLARLGQAGGVVSLSAPTLAAALALGFVLERELFDQGRIATVLEGEAATPEVAAACARGGLIALLPTKSEQGGRFVADVGAAAGAERLAGDDEADLVRRVVAALLSHSR